VDKDCDHKWLYYNYERYCRVCERIEPYKDKLAKAVNPKDTINLEAGFKEYDDNHRIGG